MARTSGWGSGQSPKAAKKDAKCKGGKCKGNFMCPKHAKGAASKWTSAHDIDHGVQQQRRPDGEKY